MTASAKAPIAVQFVALLLVCLLAAQAVSFAVILLLPPPRPPIYRASEVAAALQGGSLTARFARPMSRSLAAELPADLQKAEPQGPAAHVLAATLGAAAEDVRVIQQRPIPARRWARAVRHDPPIPEKGDVVEVTMLFRTPPMGSPGPPQRVLMAGDLPIVGEFAAAWRRPGGDWTIVRSAREPFPNEWQRRMLMWLGAGFLVVAPAGYLFARRITAPMKRFAEAAERLGRDPHAPQMKLSGPAEIGAAAHAFNDMQARLKRYIDDRTAMVGAISHDLRTPLSRIRFKMEAAPARLRDSVVADIAQMEQMIGGVLAFIRNEGEPRRRERLDLLSLVECVVDDAAMLGGEVEIVEGAPATVEGDPVALQRLFANLVENAVKHGGDARIELRAEGGSAVVSIADSGPGLRPEELELAFQPFYRADASRNLDRGGVGLGLPIARSIARAHGGDVTLVAREKGLLARVLLPLSGADRA
ncbi:MAG: ATP-binding protein [Phenylobacterium sp.]|uniref:ATP-binding protein n=1 Tax=Phenylobacterium sp. TaxID=1871053 RepID=UPI00391C268C